MVEHVEKEKEVTKSKDMVVSKGKSINILAKKAKEEGQELPNNNKL